MTTSALMILLTNSSKTTLELVSSKVTGSSSANSLDLPKHFSPSTFGGIELPESKTPYSAEWKYTPDGGKTVLSFETELSGTTGLKIVPSKTGPQADAWTLGEQPSLTPSGWLVRYYYTSNG